MPKAEVGSTKYIANKMKAKGLQRLRWYCQTCEKQCRDENGFKQHTQSEGHVRAMLLVGEDPKKYINDYSNQFKRDFLQLLRVSHGEKKVNMNNFYQQYIRDKEHIHMNSTRWPSLTEFAKYLGKEGICRVEEGDRGLEIQWIDDSPEAIRRREDIKRKERLAKGDEDMTAKFFERQIQGAKEAAAKAGRLEEQKRPAAALAETQSEPIKISMSLGSSSAIKRPEAMNQDSSTAPVDIDTFSAAEIASKSVEGQPNNDGASEPTEEAKKTAPADAPKLSFSLAGAKPAASKPQALKNSLLKRDKDKKSRDKAPRAPVPEKKMSNVELIMREEQERKRVAEQRGTGKRQRIS
jgi:DNA/RNA-binding protein KIN17